MSPQYTIFKQQVICGIVVCLDQRCNIIVILGVLSEQKVMMVDRCLSSVLTPEMIWEVVQQIFFAACASLAALGSVNPIIPSIVAVIACLMELLWASFKLLLSVFGARPNLTLKLTIKRSTLRIIDVVGVCVNFTLHQVCWRCLGLLHKQH